MDKIVTLEILKYFYRHLKAGIFARKINGAFPNQEGEVTVNTGVTNVTESNGTVTVHHHGGSTSSFTAGKVLTVNGVAADNNRNVSLPVGTPVGFIRFSIEPNVPAGELPLLGGVYSRSTYKDLWDWANARKLVKSEAQWQQLATTQEGRVTFFSSGDGSSTFRVPKLIGFMEGAAVLGDVGKYTEAGLPNITGVGPRFSHELWNGVGASGAIYHDGTDTGGRGEHGDGGSVGSRGWNFDASRSNATYGKSDTVQPASIKGMWLIKAFGSVENVGVIDYDNLINNISAVKIKRW